MNLINLIWTTDFNQRFFELWIQLNWPYSKGFLTTEQKILNKITLKDRLEKADNGAKNFKQNYSTGQIKKS